MSWYNRYIALAGLAGALVACSESGSERSQAPQPPTVIVEAVTPVLQGGQVLGPRRFVGRIAAVSTVDISFQVGGKIASLPVTEGQIVATGDVLAELDKSDYELALREAQAALDLAKADLNRKRQLARNGNVSQATLDNSETEFQLREVALDNARLNLSYATITAPFDALITSRLVEAQTNVQAGTPVLRIQDVSELRVDISVPEDLMRSAQNPDDNPEAFRIEALATGIQGEEYTFPLEFRENKTEPDAVTQTFTVTFGMARPTTPNLLPGMTVTVVITPLNAVSAGLVSVPVTAVASRSDGSHAVFVYDPTTRAVAERVVDIGQILNERIVITSGLAANEMVVGAGADRLRDGMTVRLLRDRKD